MGGLKKKVVKAIDHIPLKSVFRSFNPEEMHHEKLAKRMDGIDKFQNTNAQMVEKIIGEQNIQVNGIPQDELISTIAKMQMKDSKRGSAIRRTNQKAKDESKEELNQSSNRLKTDKDI